ncbi:hypothetical protein VPH35_050835 [Triticum aestivum]
MRRERRVCGRGALGVPLRRRPLIGEREGYTWLRRREGRRPWLPVRHQLAGVHVRQAGEDGRRPGGFPGSQGEEHRDMERPHHQLRCCWDVRRSVGRARPDGAAWRHGCSQCGELERCHRRLRVVRGQ